MSSDLGLRMIGFGPLFDALAATLDRVLELRARQNATPPGPRRLPPQKPADETTPSRGDAGAK